MPPLWVTLRCHCLTFKTVNKYISDESKWRGINIRQWPDVAEKLSWMRLMWLPRRRRFTTWRSRDNGDRLSRAFSLRSKVTTVERRSRGTSLYPAPSQVTVSDALSTSPPPADSCFNSYIHLSPCTPAERRSRILGLGYINPVRLSAQLKNYCSEIEVTWYE